MSLVAKKSTKSSAGPAWWRTPRGTLAIIAVVILFGAMLLEDEQEAKPAPDEASAAREAADARWAETAEVARLAAGSAIEVGRFSALQAEQRAAAEITTDTPCTPTELSPAAVELVRLYEELHTFKDDTEFLDMGFSPAGPYNAWMKAVQAHQDRTGFEILDEVGFLSSDVLMLGMDYISEDPSESTLSGIEHWETKIQAGLALARCEEPGTAVQDIASTTAEARRAYVSPTARPPAGADDIDERIINPCLVASATHNGFGDIDPWELRNLYPETFGQLAAELQAHAAPILLEFGNDSRSRDILLDKFRDDCIRGARGGTEISGWSEAEVLELLSLSEATQREIPLRKANGEPYFPAKFRHCPEGWIRYAPTTADHSVGRHLSDVGWLCESTKHWCQTLQGKLGREQGFHTCNGDGRPFGETALDTAPWVPTSS